MCFCNFGTPYRLRIVGKGEAGGSQANCVEVLTGTVLDAFRCHAIVIHLRDLALHFVVPVMVMILRVLRVRETEKFVCVRPNLCSALRILVAAPSRACGCACACVRACVLVTSVRAVPGRVLCPVSCTDSQHSLCLCDEFRPRDQYRVRRIRKALKCNPVLI